MKNIKYYPKINKIAVLFLMFIIPFGCSDFLEEEALTDVSLDFVYTTPEGLEAALVGLYTVNRALHNSNSGDSQRTIVLPAKSDLAVVRTGQIGLWSWLRWGHSPYDYQGTLVHNYWKHYYKVIDRANGIIKGAESSDNLTDDMKVLIAEAKTLRANSYFTLFRMFNNIYITTEPTSPSNAFEKVKDKSSEEEIFDLITEDLTFAQNTLPWNNSIGRINQATARHIHAKVALWQQDWQKAADLSESVITSGYFSLLNDPQDVFDGYNNHSETLFNVQFSNPTPGGGIKTLINWNYTANYGLIRGAKYSREFGGKGSGFIFPNQYLLELFEENDLRIQNTYFRTQYYYNDAANLPSGKSLGDPITTPAPFTNNWYQRIHPSCLKFTPENNSDWDPEIGVTQANFIIYRLAETYLIAAEANMRINGSSDSSALFYLNAIRTRAGVAPLNYLDQDTILEERARELAFEGQRWFTLKRMGVLYDRIVQYAGDDNYKNEARTSMKPHYVNFPIPQDQLNLMDPNYPQNEGYD